jgi:hypothetical protein
VSALLERDGLTFLVGESGSGKSSVLAYVASQLAEESVVTVPPRRYLPIFVPVAARDEIATELPAFGRAAAKEVLLALRGGLPTEYQDRLERMIAKEVTTQQSGPRFNAKVVARVFGSGGDVGVDLAGDVVSIVGADDLDNRGGLRTLGDVVRERGYELIVMVEDTDAWASAADGQGLAEHFFRSVVRPLANEVHIGVAVAVQTVWDALPEFADLRERAVTVAEMPSAASAEAATPFVTGVLSRRIARALGSDEYLATDAFTDAAIEMLARWTHESRGFRLALMRVRDALDRNADALPERIDTEHLLDAL